MEEFLRLEKEIERAIEEDTKNLLALGYTQEDLEILDQALEYIAYPLINQYFKEDLIVHSIDKDKVI